MEGAGVAGDECGAAAEECGEFHEAGGGGEDGGCAGGLHFADDAIGHVFFAGAPDDEDASSEFAFGAGAEAGEVFEGPQFGDPAGAGIEGDGPGVFREVVFAKHGECGFVGFIGRGEDGAGVRGVDVEGLEEFEVAVDDVAASGVGGDFFIGEESVEFAFAVGVAEADAAGGAAEAGEESAFGEALEIDGDVELVLAELAFEGSDAAEESGRASPFFAGVEDDVVELGVVLEELSGGGLDEPDDVGVGFGASEGVEAGQCVDDVADGAEFDDED